MKSLPTCLVSFSLALLCSCAAGGGAATRTYYPGPNPDLPFSSAVRVGNTVYIAGHLGRDPNTGQAPSDPKEEVRLLLDAFASTIARTGLTMDHLVAVEVHCTDLSLYDTFNALYKKRYEKNFPTRAFVGAGSLLRGCRFEILGIAAD